VAIGKKIALPEGKTISSSSLGKGKEATKLGGGLRQLRKKKKVQTLVKKKKDLHLT